MLPCTRLGIAQNMELCKRGASGYHSCTFYMGALDHAHNYTSNQEAPFRAGAPRSKQIVALPKRMLLITQALERSQKLETPGSGMLT
jgi:hypothetical protein